MRRLIVWAGVGLMLSAAPAARAEEGKVSSVNLAHIKLSGELAEAPAPAGLFGDQVDTLRSVLARIKKAGEDKNVKGLYLAIEGSYGRGQINELREAIAKVRKTGKKVYAALEGGSAGDYLIATAADEIIVPPSGTLMLTGVRMEFSYYKDLFDKLGVHIDILQMGDFKGAGEPYARSSMSEPQKKQMTLLLDDVWEQMVSQISEGRKKTVEEVKKLIDEGPFTAEAAQKAGLVDRLEYVGDFKARIAKENGVEQTVFKANYGKKKIDKDFEGLAGFMKLMQMIAGDDKPSKSSRPRIALLHCVGMITTGKSGGGSLLGGQSMGSDTIVEAIRKIAKDDKIKAVVLRVDSPGGSALASDLIWKELGSLNKPVVVSMGDVAASGGYYISMGANRIYAEPGTLTGSIGVISMKPALDGLYKKLGINTETLSRGKNSGIFADKPWTPEEREAWLKVSKDIYAQFTQKAAKGRKMDLAKLESLAGGRVWTGRQAKERGLVDELGTLDDAVAAAKKMVSLEASADVESFPHSVNPFEALFGGLDDKEPVDAKLAGLAIPQLAKQFRHVATFRMLAKDHFALIQPFTLDVK